MKFGCSDGEKGEVLPPYQHWMFDRFRFHVCDGANTDEAHRQSDILYRTCKELTFNHDARE